MTKKNDNVENPISAKEHSLSEIFSKKFEYKIPSYQRPYSWNEGQTSELFNDLYEFYTEYKEEDRKGYFLGSIILVKEGSEIPVEVVDGQQRLTTLTILLAAIRSVTTEDSFKKDFEGYIVELGNKVEKLTPKARLTLRERDKGFFKKFVQNFDEGVDQFRSLIELASNDLENDAQRNIKENSKYLFEILNEKFAQDSKNLNDFSHFLIKRCFLVVVTAKNQESAFRFFSVINSRGLNLQATDIIKAQVIGDISEDKRDDFNRCWEDMEDELGRNRFNELFYFIRMIYAKKKAKKSLEKEFMEHVIKKESNSEKLIEDVLEPYSESLSTIKNSSYESSKDAEKVNNYLYWLNQIENSDWIPVAIFFLSRQKNPKHVNLFFQKLERLSAYLYFCEKYRDSRIKRYNQLIADLEKKDDLENLPESIELNENEVNAIKNVLAGDIYNLSSYKRRYIILRLDSFMADGGARYNHNICTIEHVLPQTVREGSPWHRHFSNQEEREGWVHKMANLVLLNRRRNAKAQNYDFEKKKNSYFSGAKGVPAYPLTVGVIGTPEWTVEHLVNRQEELLNLFCDKWELQKI